MELPIDSLRIWKHTPGGALVPVIDHIASEEPLEIRVAGRSISVTMRSPGHDDELAAGFLVGEGIVARRGDIEHIRACDQADGAVADVILSAGTVVDFLRLTRHVFVSSSCGVCGAATIDAVCKRWARPAHSAEASPGTSHPAEVRSPVSPELFYALPEALRRTQSAFDRTGGLHGVGIFDFTGNLVVAREDVGRHNAVDKVIGHALLAGKLPLSTSVLLVSGRVSFEIVQKAIAAGIPIVAAISAPTSLAIELAEEAGVTLIGFLRPGGCNVYSHPHRFGAPFHPSLA